MAQIHAYPEEYVYDAQRTLGEAVDFAVMSLEIEPRAFGEAFVVSDVSRQFARGNPRYVAGMGGPEVARLVIEQARLPHAEAADVVYLDMGPEHWAGWACAFYQWYSNRSFAEILAVTP